jgi:hypothetical protein
MRFLRSGTPELSKESVKMSVESSLHGRFDGRLKSQCGSVMQIKTFKLFQIDTNLQNCSQLPTLNVDMSAVNAEIFRSQY